MGTLWCGQPEQCKKQALLVSPQICCVKDLNSPLKQGRILFSQENFKGRIVQVESNGEFLNKGEFLRENCLRDDCMVFAGSLEGEFSAGESAGEFCGKGEQSRENHLRENDKREGKLKRDRRVSIKTILKPANRRKVLGQKCHTTEERGFSLEMSLVHPGLLWGTMAYCTMN